MKRILLAITVAFIFSITAPVYAEQPTLEGEVDLTGMLVNEKGSKAKFNEYRDLNDGAYGSVRLLYDTDAGFMKAKADDIGYDTQNYKVEGGLWGAFKANWFYREIPHNTTFGANSMFTGVGSNNLILPDSVVPTVTDPTTWPTTFNYSTKRRQIGGGLSLDVAKPFFFTASVMSEQRRGIKPAGISTDIDNTTALELPEPVNYRTDTVKAELGYSKKPFFADLYFMYSDFNNKNDVLNFANPGPIPAPSVPPTLDALTLPPDNEYYKIGFKGSVKLPYNSKLNVNTGWSKTTSTSNLLSTDPLDSALALSSNTFHGKIETQNVDVALTTSPIDFFDAKVFYKYYNRDNKSDVITQTDSASEVFVNRLFDYQKNQFGGELGFNLPFKLYLNTGYTHVLTNRPLDTLADSTDDIYNVELKWRGLDFMTVRTGYERFVRNSDFHVPDPSDPTINIDGARNFDVADKTRDSVKLTVDFFPTDNLSFGIGYKHKETNYKQLQWGLKSDRSDEVFGNADVMLNKYVQLFGYFDYQRTTRSQDQQQADVDPSATWNLKEREVYYDFGAGTNIFIIPKKLTLRLQYDYAKSNGNGDLTLSDSALSALGVTGANNSNIDIPNWDDYTKQSIMAKLIYNVSKHITFAVGYAYEKFKYSDAQLDGYTLVPSDSGAFLTGAFSNQSYKANIFFATLTYNIW